MVIFSMEGTVATVSSSGFSARLRMSSECSLKNRCECSATLCTTPTHAAGYTSSHTERRFYDFGFCGVGSSAALMAPQSPSPSHQPPPHSINKLAQSTATGKAAQRSRTRAEEVGTRVVAAVAMHKLQSQPVRRCRVQLLLQLCRAQCLQSRLQSWTNSAAHCSASLATCFSSLAVGSRWK